ncbi:MAG: B-box zinc finger protein [Abditibacteriales bacterium]|nr:B-box zinc finger protein [Abditibacteriales bacterium]MDW8364338.1 B-box zinc finger protein [Abditibacteriales bacterium]
MGGNCSTHPNNPAVALCERCGDFVCRVCRTAVDGKMLCPPCFELLHARGGLTFVQRHFQLPLYALIFSVCAILTTWACLGLAFVPVSLYFGIAALKEINRRPDLPGRKVAVWSIVLSGVSVVLGIGFWVAFGFLIWMLENGTKR